jgi:hypothetical protein
VLAGLERREDLVGVGVRRGRHDDEVDVVVGEQVGRVGRAAQVRCVRPRRLDPGRHRVADRGQLEPGGRGDRGGVLVTDGAVAEHPDADGGALAQAERMAQQPVDDAGRRGVLEGDRRAVERQRADAGARAPGRDRVVAEGAVGGEQHLDVVGDGLLHGPGGAQEELVAPQPQRHLPRVATRPDADLVHGQEAPRSQSGGVPEALGVLGADQQDRGPGAGGLERRAVRCGTQDEDGVRTVLDEDDACGGQPVEQERRGRGTPRRGAGGGRRGHDPERSHVRNIGVGTALGRTGRSRARSA